MSKYQFGMVGCGHIGTRHAAHIHNLGNLLCVCDVVEAKARTLADQYHARAYTSLTEMLETEKDLQVLSVCTPNGLHAAHSIEAMMQGLHVVCEKPMAIRSGDCKAMIEAALTMQKHLFIVKQNRYNPPVVAVKKLLDAGKLGKIFSIQLNCFWNRPAAYYENSWKGTLSLDGGTLFTQFSHFIDLLYWMFGEVEKVQGFSGNLHHSGVTEFEDTGVLSLQFVNGILGSFHYTVNSYRENMEGSLTIFAEQGTIKIGGAYLNEISYQNGNGFYIDELEAAKPANHYGAYQGSMSNHDKVYENVIAVLQGHEKIATNAYEGLKTVEMIEQFYRAIRK